MRHQDVGSHRAGNSRADGESQPRHQHQRHPEFLWHVLGAESQRVGDNASQTQTNRKPHPHQLRHGVRGGDQQGANCEEKHGAHDDGFTAHPIGICGKRQAAQDGAQAASSENQSEGRRLHRQRHAQCRCDIANRLGIEAIDQHSGSTQQKHTDLEATDGLLIDQFRHVHQRCGRQRPRLFPHSCS